MSHKLTAESWKRALERDSELKELAIKAGLENNFERANELNGCYAWDCGDDVVKSEEERELAGYMYFVGFNSHENTVVGRILAAREAGIGIDDL